MRIIFLIAVLVIHGVTTAQTTHRVAVQIGQGPGCPMPLSLDEQLEEFMIYPNPTSNRINIQTVFENALVNVYSIDGHLVKSNVQVNKGGVLDLNGLPKGIYVLHMRAGSRVLTRKLRVQ